MENIDKLVQLITDRLLENLQDEPDRKTVYVIGKDQTVNCLETNGFCLTAHPEAADYMVVDGLAVDALLRVAALCPTSEPESLVLNSLLAGRKVLVSVACFDTEQYKNKAKSLLYREMLQQKAKLETYGVTFYQEGNLLAYLESTPKTEAPRQVMTESSRPSRERISEQPQSKLITETRLRSMGLSEGDVLKLEKGMIVTALAQDYIKRHRIIVER